MVREIIQCLLSCSSEDMIGLRNGEGIMLMGVLDKSLL